MLVGPPGFEPGTTSDPVTPMLGYGVHPQAGILAKLDDGPRVQAWRMGVPIT